MSSYIIDLWVSKEKTDSDKNDREVFRYLDLDSDSTFCELNLTGSYQKCKYNIMQIRKKAKIRQNVNTSLFKLEKMQTQQNANKTKCTQNKLQILKNVCAIMWILLFPTG